MTSSKLNVLHERFMKEAYIDKSSVSLPSGYSWKSWSPRKNNIGFDIQATAETSKKEKMKGGEPVVRRLNFSLYFDAQKNFTEGTVGGGLVSTDRMGLFWTTRDLKVNESNISSRASEVDDKIGEGLKSTHY